MSWLSGIAKGAEALLDRVDQTAASALQIDDLSPLSGDTSDLVGRASNPASSATNQSQPDKQFVASSTLPDRSVKSVSGAPKALPSSSKGITRSASAINVRSSSDAQLFDFLNSESGGNDVANKASFPLTSTPIRSKAASRVAPSATIVPKPVVLEKAVTSAENSNAPGTLPKAEQKEHTKDEVKDIKADNPTIAPTNTEDDIIIIEGPKNETMDRDRKVKNDRISNLQLENKLLKSEISSMNEELAGSLQRIKELQNHADHLEEKLEGTKNLMMQQDRAVYGAQEHEKDLNEALKAKDSQLAVLRVRMQEADEDAKSKHQLINRLTSENDRVLKDHTDSSGMHNVALDTIKEKLEEREKDLQESKMQQNKAQDELMELRGRLQKEQTQMAESIKSLQTKANEERGKFKDMEHNLRLAKDAADTAQRDLKEYKDKATRILQAKEKLINSLKQGTAGTDASPIVFTELEEMRQEKDLLRDDLQQMKYKFEQLKVDMFELEQQSQSESEEQHNHIENLEKLLEDETAKRKHFEEEVNRQMEELQLLKQDLQRQKSKSSIVVQEKESEIQRLNHQISYKSSINSSEEELENRVHSLTDNLIQKQSLIETLSTEKNSLSLQLERLEQQYKDVQLNLTKSTTHLRHNHHMDVEDGEEGSTNSRSIASIMPSPVTSSRRWKSTVNVIDKFSIRLGVFLRRYPVARLFVILYVFLLHLWVTIVLLTYQPEIHKHDFNSKLPTVTR